MDAPRIVSATFTAPSRARDALARLRRAGWRSRDIAILTTDRSGRRVYRRFADLRPAPVRTLATMLAVAGAGAGAFWALGMLHGFIPVVTPLVSISPFATFGLTSALGALIGGVSGALLAAITRDEDAAYFNPALAGPQTVIAVPVEDGGDSTRALVIFETARDAA